MTKLVSWGNQIDKKLKLKVWKLKHLKIFFFETCCSDMPGSTETSRLSWFNLANCVFLPNPEPDHISNRAQNVEFLYPRPDPYIDWRLVGTVMEIGI